jgi:hypothetical protein
LTSNFSFHKSHDTSQQKDAHGCEKFKKLKIIIVLFESQVLFFALKDGDQRH